MLHFIELMNENAEVTLTLIAEKADLAEGLEGIRSILLYMYRFPTLKNKKLAQKTGIAIPALAAARSELQKADIIEKRNRLGQKGQKWVKENLYLRFDYDPIPNHFDIQYENLPKRLQFLKNSADYLEGRPDPDYSYDQAHAIIPTVIDRTLYLVKKGDIEGRKLIFLGDDDATSILVGLTGLAEKITVIDIDDTVLTYLSDVAKKNSINNIDFLLHDLRVPLPFDYLNAYDVVVMDPPYTNQGLRLFLKRAKQVLRTSIQIEKRHFTLVGKKLLLCFGSKPPKEMQKIQMSILDHGFIIKEMLPDFNRYEGASILGQFSDLYYLNLSEIHEDEGQLRLKNPEIYTSQLKHGVNIPFRPIGHHFVGELRFKNQQILLKNEEIHQIFLESLFSTGIIVHDVFKYTFHPYGYTAIAILKSSHAAIHSWPEHGYISIDIFVCDEYSKGLNVMKILKQRFKPEYSEFYYLERGKESQKTGNIQDSNNLRRIYLD
ncbi:MAG: adenosylmethionine decarboxylase [Promethearchaeota archaeon]|nr:MAG: adenosylmethionine decarboxylase [Candidatus Lokiarchaeota archaeon]